MKGCTFRPNLKLSVQTHHRSRLDLSAKQEEIRGVDLFLRRLQDAQKKRAEEAAAFLLPSQRKEQKPPAKLWREYNLNVHEICDDAV